MPPRAATTRASKPRAPTSRTSRAQPSATPDPVEERTTEVEPYTALQQTIATIFGQAQKTTVGHRKLVINLRTIFDQCLAGTGSIGSTIGTSGRAGEKLFARDFCRFLNRVLVVKKSEVVGDRCLRFADLFMRNLVDGGKEKKKQGGAEGDVEMETEPEDDFEETSAVRVVLRVLNHLIPIIASKEKAVRYRTSQFIAMLLTNSLSTFPFEYSSVSHKIFTSITSALAKRLQDKEAVVRVQAAVGLIQLMEMGVVLGSDDENSDDESEGKEDIVSMLIESIQNDPSPEVRRTILYSLSPTPNTLPYLLERCRDVDAVTRRSVFTRLLPSLGDFRHLSIGMREKLLRWGLNDRDDSVRQAAQKMFNFRWVEDAGGDLLEVLERLDVTNEGIDGGPKDLALKSFWEQRQDVVEHLEFDDEYWENLTPEGAFLVRSFNDYCRSAALSGKNDIEEKMPEVTKLAFYLQRYINKLVAALRAKVEDEAADLEYIVQQLLLIASSVDFGDEIGRRKMFALLRESLPIMELSETITQLVVQGLRKLCAGESDYCELIVSIIQEVHDSVRDDEDEQIEDSFQTAKSGNTDGEGDNDMEDSIVVRPKNTATEAVRPTKKQKTTPTKKQKKKPRAVDEDEDMMDIDDEDEAEDEEEELDEEEEEAAKAVRDLVANLKCLSIAQSLLENITGSSGLGPTLVTMLNGLVVPAARSHEAPVRERGLRCMGLFCLLDRPLAEENLLLFGHCFNQGHEALQIEALHIISDILLIHGATLFDSNSTKLKKRDLYKMFSKAIKSEDIDDSVQSTVVEVVCKLMLASVIQDEELLKTLVISYFDPATSGNQSLRQTLSYFLPVYCHSSPRNAAAMATIAVPALHSLITLRVAADDPTDMVTPASIAAQLVDWTDPRKTISLSAGNKAKESVVDASTHAFLASAALDRINAAACDKAERKVLVNSVLAKCYIPKDAEKDVLKHIYEGVTDAIEAKIAGDAAGRNTLTKVEAAVGKWVAEMEEEAVEGEDRDGKEEEGEGQGRGRDDKEEDDEGEDTIMPEEDPAEESERTPTVTDVEDSDA